MANYGAKVTQLAPDMTVEKCARCDKRLTSTARKTYASYTIYGGTEVLAFTDTYCPECAEHVLKRMQDLKG